MFYLKLNYCFKNNLIVLINCNPYKECVCVIDGEYVFMCKNVSEKEKYVFCVPCKRFSLKMCIREENVVCVSVSERERERGGGQK